MNWKFSFKPSFIFVFSILVTIVSCITTGPAGIFGKKSPHEQYGDKIKNAGLSETALGRMWFAAAEQSLTSPLHINIPYSETGLFPDTEVKAVGLTFHAKRGEQLNININKKPATGFAVYLDLWDMTTADSTKPKLITSADTTTPTIKYDVEKDGNYIVRAQPELLKGGGYTLTISTGPSLAFPVTPKAKSNIESFWGAGRDAGKRKHEGIDILAPRGTAAVAAADGIVSRVTENKLGGRVVFLAPDNKDYSLYYAHLDEQLVHNGQIVKTGDTVGLIGNTGNASTTAPHLHFGIYTNDGAVDPLPFVNRVIKNPEKISAPLSNLDKWVKNKRPAKLLASPLKHSSELLTLEPNTLLKVEAATSDWYKVSLPGGEKGFIADSEVVPAAPPKINTNSTAVNTGL